MQVKKNKLNVWNVTDKDWRYEVIDQVCGIVSARWAPDGRHILVWSDFEVIVYIFIV